MSSFLESLEEAFGTRNLYEVLEVKDDANDKAIKSAYRRLALKYHPDKASLSTVGDENDEVKKNITKRFQLLSKCHELLADSERRRVYDDTGEVDEEGNGDAIRDWSEYWRLLFPRITTEMLNDFEAKYKNSDEERDDLKKSYETYKGDMNKIMQAIPLARHEDEDRFRQMLTDLIASETITAYSAFTNESSKKRQARKRKADKEAALVEKEIKKKSAKDEPSLSQIIQQRQKARMDGFFEQMELKYKGADDAEPDDDSSESNEQKEETSKSSRRGTAQKNSPAKRTRAGTRNNDSPSRKKRRVG